MLYEARTIRDWPWERTRKTSTVTSDDNNYCENYELDRPKFISISYENRHLDGCSRRAAINASQSVVSLVTSSGNKEIFQGTGTIIDDEGTILTSAKLIACPMCKNKVANEIKVIVYLWDETSYEAQVLAYDFYYSIAVLKIQEVVPQLKPACLRLVDDCVSLELPVHDDEGFRLHPHSDSYNLVPGDKLIALGRYFIKPYDLMAAPGEFSINRINDDFECKELFTANCEITKPGIGGPVINQYGETIGIASWDNDDFTPFVPLNIVLKWWKLYKKFRKQPCRPLLGMKMANLYSTDLHILEKLTQKLPNFYAGVIVQEVIQGSSAEKAGIRSEDLIVRCCGKTVQSFLELFDMMWDKTGDSVMLPVVRAGDDTELKIRMEVVDATNSNKRRRSKKCMSCN